MLVLKISNSEFRAFDNCCPHSGSKDAWSFSNEQFKCNAHGNNFSIDDVVVLNSTQVLGFAVTTTHSPNYVPSGISTAHLTTEKSTDELVTAREKNVSVSAYFASSFDF